MGGDRQHSGRKGVHSPPLTRRQQKRARRRQQRHETPARMSQSEQVVVTAPLAPSGDAPQPEAVAQAAEQVGPDAITVETVAEKAATLESSDAASRDTTGTAATTSAAALPPQQGARKYPTLARMVGIVPRADGPTARPEAADRPASAAAARPEAADRPASAAAAPAPEPPRSPAPAGVPHRPSGSDAPLVPDAPVPTPTPRRPVPTKRLAAVGASPAPASVTATEGRAQSSESPPRGRKERRLTFSPEPKLVMLVAGGHAAVATLAALAGAVLLVEEQAVAVWPLALTAVAGVGGWLAYALAQQKRSRSLAGVALLCSQLGMLAWLLAFVGPRAAVLVLVPAMTFLALRTAGRVAAGSGVAVALALYALFVALALRGTVGPVVALDAGATAVLDGVLVVLGLVVMFLAANWSHTARMRAESAARARQQEALQLRVRTSALRQQVEDDVELLHRALAVALQGQGIEPVRVEGVLSPLAESVNATAERLATLQRDREDRVRLEGAVRSVTRVVERAWLGLPWTWPAPSGTVLDELVAFLRAPRPHEATMEWSDETPTLVPIPSMDATPTSRPPELRPYPSLRSLAGEPGAAAPSRALAGEEVPAVPAVPPAFSAPPLPWREWDEWHNWDSRRGD